MLRTLFGATAIALVLSAVPATADNWTATKLRGGVFVWTNDDWQQIGRGQVVPDGTVMRTQRNGRVTLARGEETVALGPDTQIDVIDKDGQLFTTVKQWYGEVEIEAEVQKRRALRCADEAPRRRGERHEVLGRRGRKWREGQRPTWPRVSNRQRHAAIDAARSRDKLPRALREPPWR